MIMAKPNYCDTIAIQLSCSYSENMSSLIQSCESYHWNFDCFNLNRSSRSFCVKANTCTTKVNLLKRPLSLTWLKIFDDGYSGKTQFQGNVYVECRFQGSCRYLFIAFNFTEMES